MGWFDWLLPKKETPICAACDWHAVSTARSGEHADRLYCVFHSGKSTGIDFVTGLKTHESSWCDGWNDRGQCKHFERPSGTSSGPTPKPPKGES